MEVELCLGERQGHPVVGKEHHDGALLLAGFTERRKDGAQAVVGAAATRAQPILLTGLAAMLGAFFILDDPIFNGLAVSLIFGILVSTLLTLVVIPVLYYAVSRGKHPVASAA